MIDHVRWILSEYWWGKYLFYLSRLTATQRPINKTSITRGFVPWWQVSPVAVFVCWTRDISFLLWSTTTEFDAEIKRAATQAPKITQSFCTLEHTRKIYIQSMAISQKHIECKFKKPRNRIDKSDHYGGLSRTELFGSGRALGLSLSKCFGPISGLHTKPFYNIQNRDVFLSLCKFFRLTTVTSVSEVIVIFLKPLLFANTSAFFVLCSD